MYVHAAFAIDEAAALEFAGRIGFGQLTAFDGARPIGVHLPFLLTGAAGAVRIEFHVARGNAIAALADGRAEMLLTITGPDSYISPDWYVSKEQVSTWLYEAVHLTGPVRRLGSAETLGHVDRLTAKFETWLLPKPPWTSRKLSEQRRAMLLGGIIAMEMQVTRIEGQRKLNQHKSDADHLAIARALEGSGCPPDREIAAAMRGLRPGLDYGP